MPDRKQKRPTLGIRRGIPVALIIIFSSALLFQLFLFSYAVNIIWRNYTAGVISLITESLNRSVNDVFRLEGKEGLGRLTRELTSSYPGLKTKVFNGGDFPRGELIGELNENERRMLYSGNPISLSKNKKGVILVPIGGPASAGSVYSFEFDFQGLGEINRLSIIVGATSFLYILVLFVFTYFVFRKKVTAPLSNLLHVITRVEEGDWETRVKDMPPNELGRLGDVLNSALDLLDGRRRELEKTVETLEATNEELRKSRAQVIQAEKMATIGRLSSGIAHEVGNPLMAIKGYVAHLLRNTSVNDEQRDCLKRVHDDSERIEGILKGLLAHSRISSGEAEEADVEEIIGDIIESISYRKMVEKIEIVQELNPVSRGLINPEKLRQVLLNVFMNGIDAMPTSGRLTVKSYMEKSASSVSEFPHIRRRKTDPPESNFARLRKNLGMRMDRLVDQNVVIEIADTGTGIREEDKEKIFDPFFTTKEPGKGTGLGLSVTSAILNAYNGHISFESEEGRGSVFRIYVPATRK